MPALRTLHLVCGDAVQRLPAPGQARLEGGWLVHSVDGVEQRLRAIRQGETLYLQWRGVLRSIRRFDPLAAADAGHGIAGGLNAPMSGSIVRVLVEVGQQVEPGQALLVLEAMKMEHSIRAPHAGTVDALHCSEGEMVAEGAVLVELHEA